MNRPAQLRQLLAQPGPILCPGVYDCVSAKLVQRAGFPTATVSGQALTMSVLGYPDLGLQTMTEVLNQARNIARSVDIPIVVDADTGYGNALNVMRATREFEAADLAGMMIEDQTFPKRCGHFEGKKVIPAEEMVIKIKAACDARRSDDFLIAARTDARGVYGLNAAIERSNMYREAGADLILVEAAADLEEYRKIVEAVPGPLKTNVQEGAKSPVVHYQVLFDMGFKIIGYSSLLQRAQIKAGADMLELLKKEGTTLSAFPSRLCDHITRSELMGLNEFYELEERLYGPIADTEGSQRQELRARATGHASPTRRLPI